jgi:iron-sulfur cluster assembly accessory protein
MVTITERAAEQVLALMEQEPEANVLRVAVQGGGCSGLQYALGFDNEAQPGDAVAEQYGVTVIVDRFSLPYLEGAGIDYVDGLMGQGFTVDNPTAAGSCGCGKSFHGGEGAEEVPAGAGSGCGSGCSL